MKPYALIAAVAAAGAIAACSDPDVLEGSSPTDPQVMGGANQPAQTGAAGGNSATPSSNGPSGTITPPLPVPTAGPGSKASAARQFFIDKVFPTMSVCVTCHATGNLGAPKFLSTDAATAYQGLDGRALIQQNSLLLSKGTHAGGAAPALDANQMQQISAWLGMEAQERQGQAAPVNILEKIGGCLDETLFDAIKFQELRTQPREGENTDRCTGCDNAPCRVCHTGGDGSFYMAVGSALDTTTFAQTKTSKYIVKYIGLNGTTPVASNALMAKAAAVATDKPYSHPMFEISTEKQTAINAFVSNAITRYQNKQCGQ